MSSEASTTRMLGRFEHEGVSYSVTCTPDKVVQLWRDGAGPDPLAWLPVAEQVRARPRVHFDLEFSREARPGLRFTLADYLLSQWIQHR
jgi:hypothetical protein